MPANSDLKFKVARLENQGSDGTHECFAPAFKFSGLTKSKQSDGGFWEPAGPTVREADLIPSRSLGPYADFAPFMYCNNGDVFSPRSAPDLDFLLGHDPFHHPSR
jgi:hypothetical protein